MGWISIFDPKTGETEVLGDVNQCRRYNGQPHMRGNRKITESELQETDNYSAGCVDQKREV